MKKILIIGATSAIAEATMRLWAAEGHCLYLIARNAERLAMITADLIIRGAHSVTGVSLDLNDFDQHPQAIDQAITSMQGIDMVLIAHGLLACQKTGEQDFSHALLQFNTNAMSPISLLTHLANRFEAQKHGTIAVISSVAADRGRPSNYIYGAAKAALDAYCSGLRARLYKHHVHVLVIKPGFVATPMTAHLNLPPLLTANAASVAKSIHKAITRKKDQLYTPWFWGVIMFVVRSLPVAIFKRH